MLEIQPSIYSAFSKNVREECHVTPIDRDRLLAWSHRGHLTVMTVFGEIEQQTQVDKMISTVFVIDSTSITLLTYDMKLFLYKGDQTLEEISSTKSGIQSHTVQQIPEGLMWLTNRGSVITYRAGKIFKDRVSRKFFKRGEKPTAIALDQQQELIVGTSKGRVVYQGKKYDEALNKAGKVVSLQSLCNDHIAVTLTSALLILSPSGLVASTMFAELADYSCNLFDRFIVHRTSSFNRKRSPYEVWNLQKENEPVILEDTVYIRGVGAAFVDENHIVGTGGNRESISLWKANSGKKIATIFYPFQFSFTSCISLANGVVAGGTADGKVCLADVSDFIS